MGSIKGSFLLAVLLGAVTAASVVVAGNEAEDPGREASADADAQAARVEPPPAAGPPARSVPAPDLEEHRCANVVLLDGDRMCRYATPQTPTVAHAQGRAR